MKTRSHLGTVVECRTWDWEEPSSSPNVGKKKFSQKSNQTISTNNPSAPELNTWNHQSSKPEVIVEH